MADEDARQEVKVKLLGVDYVARPTWKTLSAIEGQLGQSAYSLGMKMMSVTEIGIGEMAVILRALAQSDEALGTKAPTLEDIGRDLFENGYRRFIVENEDEGAGPIPQLLVRSLRGHKVHVKEAGSAAAKGAPDPSNGG